MINILHSTLDLYTTYTYVQIQTLTRRIAPNYDGPTLASFHSTQPATKRRVRIRKRKKRNNNDQNSRDGVNGDLVTLAMGLLDCGVIAVLVGHEERSLDVAAIRILAFAIEHLLVQLDVVVVDGVVECDRDHLRDVSRWKVSGDCGSVFRAETIRENAYSWIAWRSAIWIVIDVCNW